MTSVMKIFKGCVVLVLLFSLGAVLVAQEEPSEPFLRELERHMVQVGWDVSEAGELARHLHTYRYENLEGVDPALVALALQYAGSRKGESLGIPEMAMLAANVMYTAAEMASLGFEADDITRAALNGVREMLTHRKQLRIGENTPGESQQLQERMRLQVRDCQSSELKNRIQTRTRTSNPHDPGEWTPPGPAGAPGGTGHRGLPGQGSGSGPGPDGGPGVDSHGEGSQTGS